MGIDIPLNGPKGPDGPGDAAKDAASQAVAAASENEMLLAELAFSPPEQLPRLVEKNLDRLNEDFYTFLAAKIKASTDPDEKETLALLKDAVTDLMEKILKAAMQRGDLTEEDVKAAGLTTPSFDIASGADMAVLSYDKFIDELTVDPSNIDTAVEAAFDRIDMRFLERLNERVQVLLLSCLAKIIDSCVVRLREVDSMIRLSQFSHVVISVTNTLSKKRYSALLLTAYLSVGRNCVSFGGGGGERVSIPGAVNHLLIVRLSTLTASCCVRAVYWFIIPGGLSEQGAFSDPELVHPVLHVGARAEGVRNPRCVQVFLGGWGVDCSPSKEGGVELEQARG